MNFRYKLAQFMAGRYGIDKLFYVLLGLSIVLAFVNCFIHSYIIQILVYGTEVYAVFRVLSRNIAARSKENRAIMGWLERIRKKAEQKRAQKADTLHIYKKCPKCHATLRLPHRVGKHKVVCPKCNFEFEVKVK